MKNKEFKRKFEKKFHSVKDSLIYNILEKRDHYMYELFYKKRYIGILQISRGSEEPGKRLMGLMSRQLGISINELTGINSCTFWPKDFISKSRLLR